MKPVRPQTASDGVFYRQTSPSRGPLDLPARAAHVARWHSEGDPAPAYAADSPVAAMLELPRHFLPDPGDERVLPRRRMSALHIDQLRAVDLANPLALQTFAGFALRQLAALLAGVGAAASAETHAHGRERRRASATEVRQIGHAGRSPLQP